MTRTVSLRRAQRRNCASISRTCVNDSRVKRQILAAAAIAVVGIFRSGATASAADVWNGGNGTWNTAANWSAGVPNGAAIDVAIDGGKAGVSSVTLDITASIKTLTIDAGDSLTIGSAQTLTLNAGGTVNGTLNLASGGLNSVLTITGSQSLSGSGQILFGGNAGNNFINGGGPLTIASGLSVRTGAQGGSFTVSSLTNQGLISAETSGRTLTIGSSSFTNGVGGVAQVSDGTLSITSNSWTNSGTLGVSGNGLLQLGGSFTSAGLGTVNRTGGTINLTGTLDNSGATLALPGVLNLLGTLRGGTVTAGVGAALALPAFVGGTLDGIARLDSDVTLANGDSLTVINGLNLQAGRTITIGSTGNSTILIFTGAQTFSGSGQVLLAGSSSNDSISGSGPLTIGAGISIRTGTQGGTIGPTTLTNQGLISAETPGKILTINSTAFTNSGTMQATDGTLTINAAGWTNTGTLGVSGSGILQLGGAFTSASLSTINRSGGTINITGLLDNSNATLALSSNTGSLNLAGGTLRGGTVTASGGAGLIIPAFSTATFDGIVKLDTDIAVSNGVTFNMLNSLVLGAGRSITLGSTGNSTVMSINSAQSLTGSGQVLLGGTSSNNFINGTGPLTIGPGISIRTGTQGGTISVTTLSNQGLISAETTGKTITISSTSFTNSGTVQCTDGTLSITSASWTNSGTLGVSGNGILQLGGTFTSAGLGTINRSGGTINLTGILDNTNATLALTMATTGSINLVGGTLRGGTVTTSGGAGLIIPAFDTGTFDGITQLDTDIVQANGTTLNVTNSLVFGAGRTLTIGSTGNSTVMTINGAQSLKGSSQILFAGSSSNNFINGSGPLTIESGISIRTGTQGGTISSTTLINQGLISAETAGKTLTISSASFTNSGTAQTTDGTLAITSASWTNSGTLGVSGNGILQLGGNFTSAGLGTINRSGGTINLTGVLDNTNATFGLSTNTGSFNLVAGTVRGGTVTASGGAALIIPAFANATYDGITDLELDTNIVNGAQLFVTNNLAVGSGHTITLGSTGNSTVMTFNGTQTLSGSAQVLFGGSNSNNIINGTGPLTIGSGISIRTGTQGGTISNAKLINQGLISAETAAKILTISSASFSNSGTAQASDGTLSITSTSWTNTGTLGVSGNGVLQLGGNFTSAGLGTISRSGGTIELLGIMDNTSATFTLNGNTGSFLFRNGTIRGGTVTASGATLSIAAFSTANLDGVVNLDTDFTVDNGCTLTITNGLGIASGRKLTLASSGNGSNFTISGAQTLSGSGQVFFGGTNNFDLINGSGPLTVAPTMAIRTGTQGGAISVSSLINQGIISAETSGKILTISSANFTNSGTTQATDGTLAITSTSWTNTGTLGVSGNGVLQLGGNFTTAGLGTISRTGGTIEITGTLDNSNTTLSLTATGTLKLRNGTLRGGTVTAGAGAVIGIVGNNPGTFDGVWLDSDLSAESGGSLSIPTTLSLVNGHTMTFASNHTINGGGQLLFTGTSGPGIISSPGSLSLGLSTSIKTAGQGGTLNVNTIFNQGVISSETAGKTLTINTAITNSGTVRAQAGGTLIVSGGLSGGGAVRVDTSSTLQTAFIRQTSLLLFGNAGDPASYAHVKILPKAQGGGTSLIKNLALPTDGSDQPLYYFDLADNGLAIDYNAGSSPYNSIRTAIISGRAGGAWNGPGITASSILTTPARALGYAEASEAIAPGGGTFAGQAVDGTTMLVRFTLLGDVNLDGTVGFADLVKLAQNYGISNGTATWSKGDVNYDGNVSFADLVALAQNYGRTLPAAIPGATPDFESDLAAVDASVPEPFAAPAFLSLALLGARRRRRR